MPTTSGRTARTSIRPLTLTVNYDPAALATGAKESDLYVAWWDGNNWQAITGTVDPVAKTVTVQVAHFTQYALLSKLPAPPATTPPVVAPPTPTPAKFAIAGFGIAPASVKVGETVTVTASVTNSGGTSGTYSVILKVNGTQEGTKDLTIAAGAIEKVSFSVTKSAAGTYSVDLNGQTGQFTVTAEAPAPSGPNMTTEVRWI